MVTRYKQAAEFRKKRCHYNGTSFFHPIPLALPSVCTIFGFTNENPKIGGTSEEKKDGILFVLPSVCTIFVAIYNIIRYSRMNPRINCFLPFSSWAEALPTIEGLKECPLVGTIFLLCPERPDDSHPTPEGCQVLHSFSPIGHFGNLKLMSQCQRGEYSLVLT